MSEDTKNDDIKNDESNEGTKIVKRLSSYESSKQSLREQLGDLYEQVKDGLGNTYCDYDIADGLKKQSGLIDNIMLHMLCAASDEKNFVDSMPHFALALKAQEQYRRTVETISKIKFEDTKIDQIRHDTDLRWKIFDEKKNQDYMDRSYESLLY